MTDEDVVNVLVWSVAGLLRCCLVCCCHLVHVLVIGYLQHHQSTCVDLALWKGSEYSHTPQLHYDESKKSPLLSQHISSHNCSLSA